MKRIFISALILLLFSSCSVRKEVVVYPLLFDTAVSVNYNDTVFEAYASYNENGQMKIKLVSPAELEGIIISCSADKTEVIRDDMLLEYDADFVNAVPMLQLYTVIENLNNQKPEFSLSGDELIAEAELNGIKYEMHLDSETKALKFIHTGNCVFEFK